MNWNRRNNQETKINRNQRQRGRGRNRRTTKVDKTNVDSFDLRFEGGVIGVVRGTKDQVMRFMKRYVPNRSSLVAAGITSYFDKRLISIIYLKGQIETGLVAATYVPKFIVDEAKRMVSAYGMTNISFTWAHEISWLDRGIMHSLLDKTGIATDLAKYFSKSLADLVFKNGYLRGVKGYRTNTLLLLGDDGLPRQGYIWNNNNFQPMNNGTDKLVCNSVFGDSVLLQAEIGGDFIFSVTTDQILAYLEHNPNTPQLKWEKSQSFGPIQDISVVPMHTGINTLIVSLKGDKGGYRYKLITIGFNGNLPTFTPVDEFQVPKDTLVRGFERIVRVTPDNIVTVGERDQIGFLPIATLPSFLSGPITKVLTPPVTTTPPSVM